MAFNGKRDFIVAIFLLSFSSSYSFGGETVVLNVTLNSETKGEYFVNLTDGDFLVRVEDLKAMGFREPVGEAIDISGERHVSLRSMRGVEFLFNERDVSLEITASPDLLSKATLDFTPKRPTDVYYPRDNSAFLNYGLSYSRSTPSDAYDLDFTNQVGVRLREILFLSDSLYEKTGDKERFVRLMSNFTYDRRDEMQRIVLGDSFASSGDLGSSVNLGGLSLSKVYAINLYFIKYPSLDLSGLVYLPSDVDIYLNGIRIGRERLSPGEFELRNISYYGGAGLVEVVIRDPFGGEQRIRHPFSLTDALLRRGLHEYSYNIGLLREDFGIESNSYGDPAFSAFHRYGATDTFTAGLRAESTSGLYNIGPTASFNINNAGVVTLALSGSQDDAVGSGYAGSLIYRYQGRRINTRLLFRGYAEEYTTIAAKTDSAQRVRYEAGAGFGYSEQRLGSIFLDINTTEYYRNSDRQVAALTYSRNLSDYLSAFATFKNININGHGTANEVFVGMNYYLGRNTSLSSHYQRVDETDVEMVQLQKSPPAGEGLGYRLTLQRADPSSDGFSTFNPGLQYNARYGIYEGEYRGNYRDDGEGDGYYRLSASGGIAYVGDTVGLSRPFGDSFGLLKVGDVEGVRVYRDNHEIGRTDPTGKVFIPDMRSYYDNLVTINDKDIPIDYSISRVQQYVSPPLRSGSCIIFDAERVRAITGFLRVREEGSVKPLEFHEVKLMVGEREVTFPTGKDGEFYFENILPSAAEDTPRYKDCSYLAKKEEAANVITPGRYNASFVYKGGTCPFDLAIPESEGVVIDLGEVSCEIPVPPTPPPLKEFPPLPGAEAPMPERPLPAVEEVELAPPEEPVEPAPQGFALHFIFNGTVLASKDDEETLLSAARYLIRNPGIKVEIEGHTDQMGPDGYNMRLGMRRARIVERRLIALGVGKERIVKVSSFGETKTVCETLDSGCRKKNRRAIIKILE